jgi:hypothetical protein
MKKPLKDNLQEVFWTWKNPLTVLSGIGLLGLPGGLVWAIIYWKKVETVQLKLKVMNLIVKRRNDR